MSSRALRKARGDLDLPSPGDEEEEEEELPVRRGGGANAFSLLVNNNSCSESEVKEDDDQESSRTDLQPANSRKKKKRKKKTGKKLAAKSSEDNVDLEDVEESVRWVENALGPAPVQAQPEVVHKPNPLREVLSIENKHLNPENEMKRIFGSRVVQTENRQRKQRGRAILRGSLLVTPKPSWPPASRTGLSMRTLDKDADGQWFTWDHSPEYQGVQMEFLKAVESLNPDGIMRILNAHPMHIDSMLQLSEICKMGDDSAMAAELIERTLYALESNFHPCFNLASGTCHLEYRRQENRSFFMALFRHIHYVASRACYRTALELTKILLNLDPEEDPLAAILMVDFFALRAREYQWIRQMQSVWEKHRNLSQLPNIAFSLALSTFHLSLTDPSLAKAADTLLQDALINFPDVLVPLLDKCSIDADSSVSTHPYFMDTRATPPALATLSVLYVERTHHCWKEPEVLPWLERNCASVLKIIDSKEEKVLKSIEYRKTRYQGLPRNIHRHLLISEVTAAISHLPANLSRAAVVSWDPLPPANSINTYTAPPRQPTALDDPSALNLFFRSMLPNFNPDEPLPAPVDGAVGGEEGGLDLRNSVHSLLGAMRDLLGNIQVVEALGEAGDEASDVDEDVRPEEWD